MIINKGYHTISCDSCGKHFKSHYDDVCYCGTCTLKAINSMQDVMKALKLEEDLR